MQTILLMIFILFAVIGMKMIVKVSDPAIRKVSVSLADSLGSV